MPPIPTFDGSMVENRCTKETKRGRRCANPIFHSQTWTFGHGDRPIFSVQDAAQLEARLCGLHFDTP